MELGSLSFENISPSKVGDQWDGATWQENRLPGQWRDAQLPAIPTVRTAADVSPWALSATRRLVDLAVAAAALVAFTPLMFLAAILVGLGSSGPVFFRQRRMGRNGREFTLHKFRSMRSENSSSSSITVSGDCRITPVGAFLRRFKMDELPQFWNVLRGDMSLVGPRPKLPHHEALHMTCRPGITGAATLAFRNEEEFLSEIPEDELEDFYEMFVKPAKARIDLEYMRSATPRGDLKILWRTATACLLSPEDSLTDPAAAIAQYAAARVKTPQLSTGD